LLEAEAELVGVFVPVVRLLLLVAAEVLAAQILPKWKRLRFLLLSQLR
jgi:hypothetical protein